MTLKIYTCDPQQSRGFRLIHRAENLKQKQKSWPCADSSHPSIRQIFPKFGFLSHMNSRTPTNMTHHMSVTHHSPILFSMSVAARRVTGRDDQQYAARCGNPGKNSTGQRSHRQGAAPPPLPDAHPHQFATKPRSVSDRRYVHPDSRHSSQPHANGRKSQPTSFGVGQGLKPHSQENK